VQLDPVFLMQQMELREQLSEIPEASDPDSELDDLRDQANELQRSAQQGFLTAYAADALAEAEVWVRKMQFLSLSLIHI